MIYSLLIAPHAISRDNLPEAVSVSPVGKWVDFLVLCDLTGSLHLLQAVRWDLSSCSQKQDTSLLRHGLQGVMDEDSGVISASV